MYTQASLRIYPGSHADKVSTKLSCVGLNSMHIAVHIVISPESANHSQSRLALSSAEMF